MSRADQIAQAVDRLDVANSEAQDKAWDALRPIGFGIVPYLSAAYSRFRTWQGRAALLYHATRYARIGDEAFELGLTALSDRSYMVRYRACGVLAYSLRREALPALEPRALDDSRELVRQSALAAMNAIKAGNHHLFADWGLTGQTTWHVNDGDHPQGEPAPPLPSRLSRMRMGIRPVPTSGA